MFNLRFFCIRYYVSFSFFFRKFIIDIYMYLKIIIIYFLNIGINFSNLTDKTQAAKLTNNSKKTS